MRIAIISDTHDNIPNIEKFLAWAKANAIETVIHCGDIAAPAMVAQFFGPAGLIFHCVFGNVADRELLPIACEKFKHCRCHGDQGELEIDGIKIAFCHRPDEAEILAATNKYNLVFCGHTHQPGMKTLPNNCQLINPGTLGGLFSKATFSVFDTVSKNLELKILELL
ncbi:MAG: metallophosphoesterase family protein [Patescibacteria group bacterium]